MARPMLLMFLLMILIITSQFEWRQQLVTDLDSNHTNYNKNLRISNRQEAVKEKIILSQEKNIKKLNALVQSLREQLSMCRSKNESANNNSLTNLTQSAIELDHQQFIED